ncbi:MAG TPA: DUF885 domain-containing protein [Vicinamibacterales bacterium]|nr:DUF885 domain-containing protein [Vicinamibacterales bacterium]
MATVMMRAGLIGCVGALLAMAPSAQERSVDRFFDEFTAKWMRHDPDLATATRYFSGEEQRRLERQLTPKSEAWRDARVQLAREGLEQLRSFDRAAMTETQRVSAEVMEWLLDVVVRGEAYEDYTFPFEQFRGINVELVNTLTIVHPLRTVDDAENYLARLEQVDERMREGLARAERLVAANMLPPRFIVDATLRQMRQFIEPAPAGNPFVTAFADRMAAAGISETQREPLRARAEQIVAEQVYPVWREAIARLEPLLARATDDAGLWRFEKGAEAYAWQLRRYTTTKLTADEIHQIGLREVARIEAEMDAILKSLGRTEGSLKDRIARLSKELAYPGTEEGRAKIMRDIEGYIRDAERRAAELFNRRPKAPVAAQPYPKFREASAAASYSPPAPDGSRPGLFQVPLRPSRMTQFSLRTLVYHETVPGHHFQIALEMENEEVPRFRRVRALGGISAFTEGWALYAERLAAESGWYDDDPIGRLGQLDDELLRARRLVVDTGLHAKRWTRQQAIDYGIEVSEVERYVVMPGQACAYMIGQLEILELREKAKKALGDRFSIKAFHDVVLGTGSVPLDVLSRRVDAYIESEQSVLRQSEVRSRCSSRRVGGCVQQ